MIGYLEDFGIVFILLMKFVVLIFIVGLLLSVKRNMYFGLLLRLMELHVYSEIMSGRRFRPG